MAISANTVWELRTDGADTNGGGFVTGASGTDFTDQAAAQFAFTTATTAGADAIFLDAQAASSMVGNILNITSGTNFTPGSYQVLSVVVGVSMTLDRNCTTAAGALGTGSLGGSKLTFADVDDDMIGGNICFVKAGTYTLTVTQTFTQAPNIPIAFIGFNTTRTVGNTDATRPLITTATNSVVLFTFTAAQGLRFANLEFTTTAGTKVTALANVTAVSGNNNAISFRNCKWSTAFTSIIVCSNTASTLGGRFIGCEFTGTSGTAFSWTSAQINGLLFRSCWFHHNGANDITCVTNAIFNLTATKCVFSDTTGRCIYTAANTGTSFLQVMLDGCVFFNPSTAGIETEISTGITGNWTLLNNIFYGATPWIDHANAGIDKAFLAYNNAFGGGGSKVNFTTGIGDITLSGDPFIDSTNDDFGLNNTAGAGALLRQTAYPSVFPGGLTDNFEDIGAAQAVATAGGGQVGYSQ